ncbi:MAG: hypothetical protein ACI9XK_005149, partial [Granulosicoccus sp.]
SNCKKQPMQYKHPFKLLDLIVKERANQRSV